MSHVASNTFFNAPKQTKLPDAQNKKPIINAYLDFQS